MTRSKPAIHVSGSRNAEDVIHLSIVNLDPTRAARVTAEVEGRAVRRAAGRVLTAKEMDVHSDFDAPARVAPAEMKGVVVRGRTVEMQIPSKSVVVVELAR